MVLRPADRIDRIDRGDHMTFMPHDVLKKNFTATQFRRGYDEHEVDDFLDQIVVELRRLTSDNDDLRELIPAEAQDKIAAAKVSAEKAEKDAADRIAKANALAEQAEEEAAERAKAAQEAADEIAKSVLAVVAPAVTGSEGRGTVDGGAAEAAGLGSAAGVLVLAQKLHDEYVSEGHDTRERLISEGQLRHDQVVGEATARQEELLSTGQAKHDEFVSVGGAKRDVLIAEATAQHEHMITEARERSTGMVSDAQQKRAEVLQTLGRERSSLQTKIEELGSFERDYRARLKSYLEGQLVELEQTGADEMVDSEGDGEWQVGQRSDGWPDTSSGKGSGAPEITSVA
jgi:DivIVA domain-containing protein